jgi:8-oxo-dGTP pyrophosphatase MutT (NUDIX family)
MKPIPAATVLLVRDGDGIEVVMGLRPPGGAFGGIWVFPGGAVEPIDIEAAGGDDEIAWRLAGLRETAEETGILITTPAVAGVGLVGDLHRSLSEQGARFATERLVYLSNWVTPRPVKRRFDTRFYLVVEEAGASPNVVSSEFERIEWVPVAQALARETEGGFPMIFPTIAHLRYVGGFGRVGDLLSAVRSLDRIPQIEPRLFERGGRSEIEVSGDPRFES